MNEHGREWWGPGGDEGSGRGSQQPQGVRDEGYWDEITGAPLAADFVGAAMGGLVAGTRASHVHPLAWHADGRPRRLQACFRSAPRRMAR